MTAVPKGIQLLHYREKEIKAQLLQCYEVESSIKKPLITFGESRSKGMPKHYLMLCEKVLTQYEQQRLQGSHLILILRPTHSSHVRF